MTRLGRRSFLLSAASLLACKGARAPINDARVAVWSWFDLPRDLLTSDLSGMAWDESARIAYVVQDKRRNIVALVPDGELRRWQLGGSIPIESKGPVDLEALALLADGFVIASEIGPRIFEVDREGHWRREILVPQRFQSARKNKSLESVALSPDKRFLFTANEGALPCDGPLSTDEQGTRVRIIRIDRATGTLRERMYTTDRAAREGGDCGVADLAALSSTEVLVLERGWSNGYGNTVRIYRASLDDSAKSKSLVVDLAQLDVRALGLPKPKEPQPTPLLENFEGLSLGPRLPNAQRSLLLVSDDNSRNVQVARVLVLTFTP